MVGDGSFRKMFDYFSTSMHWNNDNGIMPTLHPLLSYHILESKKLMYKLVWNNKKKELGYSFHTYAEEEWKTHPTIEVPCMSTCGMMMSRATYDYIGGWPEELGIYGGGEHFINYTMAVLGLKKYVYRDAILYHHGDQRSYSWNYDDYTRNRAIACYLYGGKAHCEGYIKHRGGSKTQNYRIMYDVFKKCEEQREDIKTKQVEEIYNWMEEWRRPPNIFEE
jgi:hypothetical protein